MQLDRREEKSQVTPDWALDPSFKLLKEARKSWDYIVSDKFVYVLDTMPLNLNSLVGIAKSYAHGDSWMEFHLTLHGERETHYVILVESHQFAGNGVRKSEVNASAVDGNTPVFVDVAQFVEFPQQIGLNACSIPSVMRLKRIDNCDCAFWHADEVLLKLGDGAFVPFIEDRKLGSLSVRPSGMSSQSPDQLVETGTKAEENVSSNQRQSSRWVDQLNFDLILASFNVVFAFECERLRLQKDRPLPIKSIKMFLRPSGFQIGVSEVQATFPDQDIGSIPNS